jgi:hypothetical protein
MFWNSTYDLLYYMLDFFLVPFLRWLEVVAARKVGKEHL